MINKSKIAIFSDLHLGIYGNSEDWHSIALYWCDWICDSLKKNNIKDIFFLGDFFHNRSEISVQTVHVASEILSKFKEFNIFMIVGNHDAYYKNRSDVHSLGLMKGHDNITVIDKRLDFVSMGKKFTFIPWEGNMDDLDCDYLFGHFEIESFKMNNFKICEKGLSPSKLVEKCDKVFSGHFHNRHNKTYKEGEIYYVGSTFHQDFSDCGNSRGYYIFDVEDGELEFVENDASPNFVKMNSSDIKENKIYGNYVKVIIDTDDDIEELKKRIQNLGPYKLITEFNTKKEKYDDIEITDSINILELFDEFMGQMKLEDEKYKRVDRIIKNLYEKNSL